MNESQWLEWRMNGIGASDAPIIMGVSPWKTPYQLWKEKVFKEVKPFENSATTHGKEQEDRALEWLEEKTGVIFFPQVRVEKPGMEWMRATLDGISLDRMTACEIKCPFHLKNHEEVKKTRICPEKYYPQLQHQMCVADLDKMIFLSYNSQDPDDSVLFEVLRNDQYMDNLIRTEEWFWDSVRLGISPQKEAKDLEEEEKEEEWRELIDKINLA